MIYNLPKNTVGQGDITADDQFRWHRTMQCMFDAAPKGSKIMITMFSWADQPSADALRAADARGVTVQLIMWNGRTSSVMPEFAKSLNDGKTAGSYFKVCKDACLGATSRGSAQGHPPLQDPHLQPGQSAGRPGGQEHHEHRHRQLQHLERGVVVQRVAHRPGQRDDVQRGQRLHRQEKSDKDQRTSKVKTVALGETTMYLYPQKSYTPDLQLDLLKATSCKGAKKTIRVAQYMWTVGRKPIADRLAVLKKAGCDVKVILNNDSDLLDASVLKVLLKAKIPVYNAHRIGKIHTHAKDVYISALVGGKQQNLVVSGSLNMTRGSLNANDEAGYKINSAAAFAQYNALWNIWAANSKRIGGASVASDQAITVPTTNDPTLIED